MKKGIVVAFPGIRYTCGQPLVQDCLAFYKARGYETLCLDFAGVSFDGTADMSRAAEAALPSILGQLSDVCLQTIPMLCSLQKAWERSVRCAQRRRWLCSRDSFC